jgi:hypothetical protein
MASGRLDEPTPPQSRSPVASPELRKALQTSSDSEQTSGGGAYWALSGWYDHPQPGSRLLQYGMTWSLIIAIRFHKMVDWAISI